MKESTIKRAERLSGCPPNRCIADHAVLLAQRVRRLTKQIAATEHNTKAAPSGNASNVAGPAPERIGPATPSGGA